MTTSVSPEWRIQVEEMTDTETARPRALDNEWEETYVKYHPWGPGDDDDSDDECPPPPVPPFPLVKGFRTPCSTSASKSCATRRRCGIISILDGASAVFKSDKAVSVAVRDVLRTAVKPLEEVSVDVKDWRAGSNGTGLTKRTSLSSRSRSITPSSARRIIRRAVHGWPRIQTPLVFR